MTSATRGRRRRTVALVVLAMAVTVDEKTGEGMLPGDGEAAVSIWDVRDDPEGMVFAEGEIEPAKVRRVQQMIDRAAVSRSTLLGYVVQPVEDECIAAGRHVCGPKEVSDDVED